MLASLPAAFLLLLAATRTFAQSCPPPAETEGRCIELTADGSGEVSEVQISPGGLTTFLFDSDILPDGLTLENRERFEVADLGRRTLTLVPSETVRGETPGMLTVCFADGEAPPCAIFRLVVHPALGEQRVEVFRHPRPVESIQAELKNMREENVRLRAEFERMLAERNRPEGLPGLFVSGMVGDTGISSQGILRLITERKGNTLVPRTVMAFRAASRVAMELELELENPEGAKPWTPRGAVLVGPRGERLEATFWPAEPIPPGKRQNLWLEVMAPAERTQGPFLLKIWEADGPRTFVIGNVTFPALAEAPGP